LSEFGVCRARKDGLNLYCKGCIRQKIAQSRQALREYKNARIKHGSTTVPERSRLTIDAKSGFSPRRIARMLRKLSPADRAELEEKLMSDAQVRREFNIAREIHRSGGDAREVLLSGDDAATAERGARMAKRIAIGAIALVFLNVFIGLGVITWKRSKPAADAKDAAIRQQLENSLGAAAKNAMPAPSLSDDEIQLSAPKSEWGNLSAAVIAAAETCGGSALKDETETNLLVTASVPRERVAEFRKKVLGPTAAANAAVPATAASATIQVRISAPAQ
jgi:hypothetical protein